MSIYTYDFVESMENIFFLNSQCTPDLSDQSLHQTIKKDTEGMTFGIASVLKGTKQPEHAEFMKGNDHTLGYVWHTDGVRNRLLKPGDELRGFKPGMTRKKESRPRKSKPPAKKIMCVYCDREFNPNTYSRWHGERCKHNAVHT